MTLLSEVPIRFIYRPLHRSLPSFPQPHYHSLNLPFPLVLELDSIDICIEISPLHPTSITPTPTHLNTVTQLAATPSEQDEILCATPPWHHRFCSLTESLLYWHMYTIVFVWVSAVYEGEHLHLIKRRAKAAGKSRVNREELLSLCALCTWFKLPVSKVCFIITPKRGPCQRVY